MKTLFYIFLFFIVSLVSCTKQTITPIETYSADKKMKIELSASRTSALDAWMIEIALTHNGTVSKIYQEFYADEVSKKNVVFEWKTDRSCVIHLTQRDGVVIHVPITVHE
jgi:hypothetical protein